MSKKLSKVQKARAAALEAALIASARAGEVTNADSVQVEPEEVLTYAKFILGKRPAKRKDATGHLNMKDGRAYWAPAGEPLPNPWETSSPEPSSPVAGLSPAAWGAALKEAAKNGWSPEETEEHLGKCSRCRELAEADARGRLIVEEPIDLRGDFLSVPGTWREGAAGCQECEDEQSAPIGEDPGDAGIMSRWAETIRQQDAAREADREAAALEAEPEVGETNDSAGAKNWVLQEGARVGCPECTAEADRRRERDESLKRGRRKLASRIAFRGQLRTGPLDEDELLAVAGSELYPAGDEEPSRELKIRNRKGEVRSYIRRSGAAGWTLAPLDGWSLRLAWTSSEMVRRGPWHVV